MTPEQIQATVAAYRAGQLQTAIAVAEPKTTPEWENPTHKEVDPFDADYDTLVNAEMVQPTQQSDARVVAERGLIPSVKAAVEKGFPRIRPNAKR